MAIGNDLIGDIERLVLDETIKSKELFRFPGKHRLSYTHSFEKQITEMYCSHGSIMFPSATLALLSFINIRKYKKDAEIITSPFSWVADYSAILFSNNRIRFYSIDENLQVNVESLKRMINDKTALVIVPHLMGRGQQSINEISKICRENNIDLVEDIAQSFGVKINGQYAGTFGDFAFSSFNHHKILSTGDGGIGIVNNKDFLKPLLQIHDQGCLMEEGNRSVSSTEYTKGLSLRVSDLVGAVATAQLARFSIIKNTILNLYSSIHKNIPKNIRDNILEPSNGDIPYTILIKVNYKIKEYPSLVDSGWHFIENVPYFKDLSLEKGDLENIIKSKNNLNRVYSIGCGFIDKYYSTPEGVRVKNDISPDEITKIFNKII